MRIIATPIRASALLPGDLFSTAGPDYWRLIDSLGSIGERAYIRTNTPASSAPDAETWLYKLTIEYDPEPLEPSKPMLPAAA